MGKMADIDEVMYSCGLEILHPGGIEKTDEMARMCEIGKGKRVLDIGSGKGVTACHLAQKYECEVVGVDLSERMVEYAKERAKKYGLEDKVYYVWEGFRTMTLEGWKEFYERMGMVDVKTADFSEAIPDMEKAMKKKLGLRGMTKMIYKLLLHSDLREVMNEYRKIFKEYSDYIGSGYIVGKKK